MLFLAGGIAFNLILAALPFILLLVNGLTYLLPLLVHGGANATDQVRLFIDALLPAHQEGSSSIDALLAALLTTRRTVTLYSSIGFIWFSTRMFGSLRTVLASVFDIESERGIIAGKIFDVKITILSTLLFVASVTISVYVNLATKSGASVLESIGLRTDVMGELEAWVGRGIAFVFIALMFFALYKFLPIRRVRTKTAWMASLFTSVAFEGARGIFSYYTATFNPASLYTGTAVALTAIIIVVFWCYYGALIFILGGEVGQVYELRRMRKLQREVLSD